MSAGARRAARIAIPVAIALVVLALPAIALGDPGHRFGAPHLEQQQSSGGGGSSSVVIIVTFASLILLAVCAVILKQAQQKRGE